MKLISNFGETKLTQRIYVLPRGFAIVVAHKTRNKKSSDEKENPDY